MGKMLAIVLSLAIIIGFFLPMYTTDSASTLDLVRVASVENGLKYKVLLHYAYILIPLFALTVLIMSATGRGTGVVLRILPFIVYVGLTVYLVHHFGQSFSVWFKGLSIGSYLMLFGSLLLIFAGNSRRTS